MTAVGVAGHRFLAEVEKVKAGIEEALDAVGSKELTVMSSLAEGSDRMAAEAVLARDGGRLVAVLPLPAEDYATDFASEESRAEFGGLLDRADEIVVLGKAESREHAYEAAGRYVAEKCDVLLVVWDGRPAQGRGGVAGVVEVARSGGKPVAWVHAGNRRPGTSAPTSLGAEQGVVTYEGLP